MLVLVNITLDTLIVAVKSLTLLGCDKLSTCHCQWPVSIMPPPPDIPLVSRRDTGTDWEAWPFFPDREEDFHLLAMSAPGKWQNQESGKMFLLFLLWFPLSSVLCGFPIVSYFAEMINSFLQTLLSRFPLSPWVIWSKRSVVKLERNLSLYTAVKTPLIHAC